MGSKHQAGGISPDKRELAKRVERHFEPFLLGPTQAQPSLLDAHCAGAAQKGH